MLFGVPATLYHHGITKISWWTGHWLLCQETSPCCDYITSAGPDFTNLAIFTSSKADILFLKETIAKWKTRRKGETD